MGPQNRYNSSPKNTRRNSSNSYSYSNNIHDREKDLLRARELATKKAKDIERKRTKHNIFSFILIAIISTLALTLYPSTTTAGIVAVCLCIFFCISLSNQRQVNRALLVVVPLLIIALVLKSILE